jgi:hypothetical protein
MANSKKELMIERTHEYLKLHAHRPDEYPVNVSAIAQFVPCSRTLFYKDDPEIANLLACIETKEAGAEQGEQARLTSPDDGLAGLDELELHEEIERTIQRAALAMKQFLGYDKRRSGPMEAPLAAHDLDVTISKLRGVQADLAPLVIELQRRKPVMVEAGHDQRATQITLSVGET